MLDLLCSDKTLADSTYQIYKFYECIFDTIQNSQLILNPPTAEMKFTEGDYTYQIWLPLIKKLFNINGDNSNVRLKVAESVLDNSTDDKKRFI